MISVILVVIGYFYLNKISEKNNYQITQEPKNQVEKDYYDLLEEKCVGQSCCLASLKFMRENDYKERVDKKCPNGFKGGGLKCVSSLSWCEPEQKKESEIDISNWKTYRNEELGFEFKYPEEIDGYFYKDGNTMTIDEIKNINIKTTDEIKKEYENWNKKGGCPGRCDTLAKNEDILEKQFEILGKASKCPYSDDFQKEIRDDFILFTLAMGGPSQIRSIYNKNFKQCGLATIYYDGHDICLCNYFYRAGFLVGDKVIKFDFPLFPRNIFKEVDEFLSQKDEDDINIDFNSEFIQSFIEKYDNMVRSFKFLNQDEIN